MTLEELDNWIDSAQYVECAYDAHDGCSNHYRTIIYEKDGKYYQIEYLNDHPHEDYIAGKGAIRGQYSVQEVEKVEVVDYNWIPKEL
jgi:hypothetical protein